MACRGFIISLIDVTKYLSKINLRQEGFAVHPPPTPRWVKHDLRLLLKLPEDQAT